MFIEDLRTFLMARSFFTDEFTVILFRKGGGVEITFFNNDELVITCDSITDILPFTEIDIKKTIIIDIEILHNFNTYTFPIEYV